MPRWGTVVSGAVIGVCAAVVVASSILAEPVVTVRQVELNDGGIWVTSDRDGLFARLNRPAASFDAAFYPPGGAQKAYALDVVQDGAAVAAWDRLSGRLFPVDVVRAVTVGDKGLSAANTFQAQLAGGTLAVLDPASGHLWAERVDPVRGITSLAAFDSTGPPLATVGKDGVDAGAALAVGLDGTVHAVSVQGRVATIHTARGGLGAPEYSQLNTPLRSVRATAVGARLVVLDRESGVVLVDSGVTASLGADADSAELQEPGPGSDSVLVASSDALIGVRLGDGELTRTPVSGGGVPARPVRLDNCVHAAWSGTGGGYRRACDGGPLQPGNLKDAIALQHPVFRRNRGAIVLNDLTTGAVWDLLTQRRVDDWSSVKPPPIIKKGDRRHDTPQPPLARDEKPKAVDDTLGARPGRTTLLHVLDNDSDPAGKILSITEVRPLDGSTARLSIAPDGQSVAITVAQAGPPVHFTYTVDDGTLNAKATVTVEIRLPAENKPPQLRPGYTPPSPTLPSGGHLALPVLADWRDFDGDPIALVDVEAKAGVATTTPDGFIDYRAPAVGGLQRIAYHVTDTRSEPQPGSVEINVQGPTATNGVPPVTQPDVARGQVGQPILLRPLDNDLPGSDPTSPAARLRLAGDVVGRDGASAVTDLKAGTVTVTGRRAGPVVLEYTAAFGNAPFAKGAIRVDVVPVPASPAPPVAMPDFAVLHGQTPAMVDVLANDFDPAGGVLVLQRAEAPARSPLEVAVVQGRWLRVSATTAEIDAEPQVVRYTVTDGVTGPVTGEVTVTRLGDPKEDAPVTQDDFAVVRSGQVVTVAVLDNDVNAAGAPMTLAASVAGAKAPGRLPVSAGGASDEASVGMAYVTGNAVRYAAPAKVSTPLQTTVDYVAQNAAGDQVVGHLHVTVQPLPSTAHPNQPPNPLATEVRAVAGQTVVIALPTSDVDPDGDAVSVTGLASPPKLGRITAISATSLTYQAYPTSGGTDTFGYQVIDGFGGTGQSTIRVAVTPAGAPQPPLAVADQVTAAPGARLRIDVLDNDITAPDAAVTIADLGDLNPDLRESIRLLSPTGPIELTAPELTGKPLIVRYAITDGLSVSLPATVTVRSQRDYDNPPQLFDAYPQPQPGAKSVTIDIVHDVPALAVDVDGDASELEITSVGLPTATVSGSTITVPLDGTPQTVSYEVRDRGGATALGLIHLPSAGDGIPYVLPGKRITVPLNGSVTVAVADYVASPAGKPIHLTLKNLIAGSPKGLVATSADQEHLVVTASGGYAGPGAVGFEVTDGDSVSTGRRATLSVPVQVGPERPVLRCPADPLMVVEGGATVAVDVTSVCHVWAADPGTLPGLAYDATWADRAENLSIDHSGQHVVDITAGSAAVPGTTATMNLAVRGTDARGKLTVKVVAPAPLSVTPIVVDGVKAGDTATIDLARYARSQLKSPAYRVLDAHQVAGDVATANVSGSSVSITPGAAAHGTMRFLITVTDVADDGRTDRHAVAQATLHVLGVPDAPGVPAIGRTVLSHSVQLSWPVPANNGVPIEVYEVAYDGGTQTCPGSPCLITGLNNGSSYRFTVRARNLVGWGRPSRQSAAAVPDTVPGAVTALVVSNPQDGTLDITWGDGPNDGTKVQKYEVTWANGGHATAPGRSLTATGLDNDSRYTFTVIAVNAQGPGPSATVDGQSAGAPPRPPAPSFASVDSADSNTRAVQVSWPDVDPNGSSPTTYTVVRTGGGTKTVCSGVAATSCADDGLANDGTVYTYTVTAANAAAAGGSPAAHTSPPSPGTDMEATATPDAITGFSAAPTGVDGQATLSFTVNNSHGATSTVGCTFGGNSCGSWTFSSGGQSGVTRTVTGLPNGQPVTVSLVDCNGSHGGAGAGNACGPPATASVTTFGPLKNLTISTSASGPTVNFTVSVDPNGRPATVLVQTSRQTQSFTTGVGAWSWSGSDNVGYSSSDTVTVTVSDSGRSSLTDQKTQNTGAAPPPPPTVTVSRGAPCGGGGGAACAGGSCVGSTCGYIHVTTANFGGNVSCTFNSQHGPGGFVQNVTWGANQSKDSPNWYGYKGEWVSATCGGVTGTFTWP